MSEERRVISEKLRVKSDDWPEIVLQKILELFQVIINTSSINTTKHRR